MEGYIDIRKLNLDELVGVVNLYPWFGSARKELCERMSRMGEDWSGTSFSEAAMYVASRSKLAAIRRMAGSQDLKDTQVESLLKTYIHDKTAVAQPVSERKVMVVGGDYFSQEAYDQVRRTEDNVFSRYAAKAKKEQPSLRMEESGTVDIYTETLAQIYADQGYLEQAKEIYSKLILAYPEKNAYFAALIRKIEEINS